MRPEKPRPIPGNEDVPPPDGRREPLGFIREIVRRDTETGVYGGRVVTRFPPEPNGYLHIGHAKSICLNFGIAREFGGVCHLRFDDTNPETEDMRYVEAIMRDVRWLGFDWGDKLFFASDYYERLHGFAVRLIEDGKAYVDSLSDEEIREYRGTVTTAGRESPWRERPVDENLDLFARMRAGEFQDGAHVLRAKIDMAAANMKMRDPLLYRIRHKTHYRTGDAWCIYPMYDFAHPLSDAIENVTHSICTLEFENNRAIYDWLLDSLVPSPRPRQYEFARLNLDYAVMSKRKLLRLVEEGIVSGWDDPRMPTVAGLRRRGYSPEGIRLFASRIGVDKTNSRVSMELLEDALRDDLNARCPRVMAVLRPLKVTISTLPADAVEWLDAPFWPRDIERDGSRKIPLTRELFIERTDFSESPPPDWLRLSPGREVRLRNGYFIRCEEAVRDPATGEVAELHCTHDPSSLAAPAKGNRKKSTAIQWVSAAHAFRATVRLYDRLCSVPDPEASGDGTSFTDHLNPESVTTLEGCLLEPGLAEALPGDSYQFVRHGYFVADENDSGPGAPVFNRIIELRDSYGKEKEAATPSTRPPGGKSKRGTGELDGSAAAGDVRPPRNERPRERSTGDPLALRCADYVDRLGIPPDLAEVLTGDAGVADFFDAAVAAHGNARAIANWTANDVVRELKGRSVRELPFGPAGLAALVAMVDRQAITGAAAKTVFAAMMESGGTPDEVVSRLELDKALSAADLSAAIDGVLRALPDKVSEYRSGKTGLLGLFTGHAMRATGGKADPRSLRKMLIEKLG